MQQKEGIKIVEDSQQQYYIPFITPLYDFYVSLSYHRINFMSSHQISTSVSMSR